MKRELSDKEQELSKMRLEKEELHHQKENLEARLQTYKSQQKHTCVPCRSCGLCKPVHICTCATGSSISTGDINTTKVFLVACNLRMEYMSFFSYRFEFPQIMLERLERERDTARADVERLIEERDALRERLKVTKIIKLCIKIISCLISH